MAAWAALWAAQAAAGEGPYWVQASEGHQMQYFIDAESVRTEGPVTHYRLFGRGTQEVSQHTTVEAEVGVNCQERTRVEYVTTVRWRNGVQTTTAHEMKSVFAGTRQASEVDKACALGSEYRVSPHAPPDALVAPARAPQPHGPGLLPAAAIKWTGTGFAVAPGTLVTNNHVVHGCSRIQVTQGQMLMRAELRAVDPGLDLAALQVSGGRLHALELSGAPRRLGDVITVLGYPLTDILGADLRASTGIVSALSGVQGDPRNLQISAPVQAGTSGAPLLDESGAVAGVVVKRLAPKIDAENVSFAVRLAPLVGFLQAHSIAFARRSAPGPSLKVADVVRKSAASVYLVLCH